MIEQILDGRTCPHGHPVRPAARFCPVCGAGTATVQPAYDPVCGAGTAAAQPAYDTYGQAATPQDPAWPPPAPVPPPAPGSRRPPWGLVTFVVTVGLLLGVGGGAVGVRLATRPRTTAVPTAPTAVPTTVTPTVAPTAAPSMIGIVDITAVRADSRAETVGTVLNEYFSGINDRDIPRVLAVMDPTGVVDRDDPRQVELFRANVSTTTDTDVVVHWVGADSATGGTQAGVTFTSRQDARYGPDGQTCSNWTLTYLFSNRFLIVRTLSSHRPC